MDESLLLDPYLPKDIPGFELDPEALWQAKRMAMIQAGLGMASGMNPAKALAAGVNAYSDAQTQTRRDMLSKLQAYRERQLIQAQAEARARELALAAKMTPEQRRRYGITDEVWDAMQATGKLAEQFVKKTEPYTLSQGQVRIVPGIGEEAQLPDASGRANVFAPGTAFVVGQTNVPGATKATAETEEAKQRAAERARAAYDVGQYAVPEGAPGYRPGQTVPMTRLQQVEELTGDGLPPAIGAASGVTAANPRISAERQAAADAAGSPAARLRAWQAELAAEQAKPNPNMTNIAALQREIASVQREVAAGVQPGKPRRITDPLAVEREKGRESTDYSAYVGQIKTDFPVAAAAARKAIPLNHQALAMLDSGQVITGKGANFATEVGGWLARMGIGSANDPVATTQTFMINQAQETLAILQTRALGAGTGISKSDQEFAQKLAGGNVEMNEQALRRIIKINESVHRATIDQHNDQVNRAAKAFDRPSLRDLYEVPVPPEYSPPTNKPAATTVTPTKKRLRLDSTGRLIE